MRRKKLLASSLFLLTVSLTAQTLEPRLYAPVPVGMNFLVGGYSFSEGALPGDSVLVDPKLDINAFVVGYARGIDIAGKSSKISLVIPSARIDGSAFYEDEYLTRDVRGVGDIQAKVSIDIYGAPATSLKNFASYKQDTVVGVSFQVTAPTGESMMEINFGSVRIKG